MNAERITCFATAMTGETFALLRDHSILAPQLTGEVVPGPAFLAGVDVALAGTQLLEALFGVRSRVVLRLLKVADADAYASGILIGSSIGAHRADGSGDVAVIGRPELCELYAAALARAGRGCVSIDGAEAFVAGMMAISGMIEQ